MCNFQQFAMLEWGDDIELITGIYAPLVFICRNCKLLVGTSQKHYIATPEEGMDIELLRSRTMLGTDEELTYPLINEHLALHQAAGHNIHPMVFEAIWQHQQLYAAFTKKI